MYLSSANANATPPWCTYVRALLVASGGVAGTLVFLDALYKSRRTTFRARPDDVVSPSPPTSTGKEATNGCVQQTSEKLAHWWLLFVSVGE